MLAFSAQGMKSLHPSYRLMYSIVLQAPKEVHDDTSAYTLQYDKRLNLFFVLLHVLNVQNKEICVHSSRGHEHRGRCEDRSSASLENA